MVMSWVLALIPGFKAILQSLMRMLDVIGVSPWAFGRK
ncbi:Unknown protein sequence [Pseudomonas syringae pv. maculicola]|nr:Unknown protein sequence [Pseudomonas syringae pv. maculicola]